MEEKGERKRVTAGAAAEAKRKEGREEKEEVIGQLPFPLSPSPTSERAFNQLLSEYESQFPFFCLLLRSEFLALPGGREREEGKSNGA